MSRENVEVVRKHLEAFTHDADRAISFFDAFVVMDRTRVGALDDEVVYGKKALSQAVVRYLGAFEDYAYDVVRLTDAGSGAILATVNERGRGKASGALVQHSFAALYTVIDGKIARITFFPSEEQALEAVGLRE
jgi:ketosteroid isomerase-like protein